VLYVLVILFIFFFLIWHDSYVVNPISYIRVRQMELPEWTLIDDMDIVCSLPHSRDRTY